MVDGGEITREEAQSVNLERLQKAIVSANLSSLKNCKLFREKEFLTEVDGKMIFPDLDGGEKVVLQGVIDLLAIDKDEAIIIDYKYSTLTKEGLLKKYKKQLDLYAYAVENSTDKKVRRKTLVNIFTGESVEVD
jgi:ATP-dependent helicase/nuclease subunit A